MAAHFSLVFWFLQDDDTISRWTRFWVGETTGLDWLLLLVGTLFVVAIGYVLYSTMLRNLISANWHPADFRKLIFAVCFLLWIIWFHWVFWHAFGFIMLYIWLFIWIVAVVVFLATRRKAATT